MSFDKYSRIARLYPAVLTALPALLLTNNVISQPLTDLSKGSAVLVSVGHSGLSLAIIYLVVQINRMAGKGLEAIVFRHELSFPTTKLLMPADTRLSPSYKKSLIEKIRKDFHIDLTGLEQSDNSILRLHELRDAIALVRSKMKSGHLVLQHNAEYGFIRNLFGGSFVAFPISVAAIMFALPPSGTMFYLSLGLAIAYLFVIIIGKFAMKWYGFLYAKILFSEYLSTSLNDKI